jgi:hypothetical protein
MNDGTFSFFDVPAGTYRLLVNNGASGVPAWYPSGSDPNDAKLITVDYGDAVTGIDVTKPDAGYIRGSVVDSHGEPVQSACITVTDPAHPYTVARVRATKTDSAGNYVVSGISPGSYVVDISGCVSTAYGRVFHGGATTTDDAQRVPVEGGRITDIGVDTLPDGGSITGHVSRPAAAWVYVIATSPTGVATASVISDSTGNYTLPALNVGDWTVRFEGCRGYAGVTEWWNNSATAAGADPVPVAAGAATSIDATLSPVTKAEDCGPQGPPVDVEATADTAHSAHLTWAAPNGNQLPERYKVAIAGGPVGYSFILPGDLTEATMGGLQAGHDYTFTVTAMYSGGTVATAASNPTLVPSGP